MNKDEENQIYPCSKCGNDFEITYFKGFKFKKAVVKKLRCPDCAWGGKEGMDRHIKTAARFEKEMLRQFTEIAKHGIGVSPGPEFNVNLTVTKKLATKNGFHSFSLGGFEGHPVTLTIRVPQSKGKVS